MRKGLTLLLLTAACGNAAQPDLYSADATERFLGAKEVGAEPDGETILRLKELLSDPHYLPRVGALEAFGRIGRPEFYPAIKPLLLDPSDEVRGQACVTAEALGDPAAVPELAELAGERQEKPRVRVAAVRALASFGNRHEVLRGLVKVLNEGGGAAPRPDSETQGEQAVITAAHQALQELTGQSLPDDRKAWEAWLSTRAGP